MVLAALLAVRKSPYSKVMRIRNGGSLLALGLASSTALLGLGAIVLGGRTADFDGRVRAQFPRYRRSRTKRHAKSLGPLGKTWLHLPITGGVAAYLLLKKKGADSAVTVMTSALAASAVSDAFEKFLPRRHAPWGRFEFTEPSFPSGHALRASTVSLVTAYVLVRENVGNREIHVPVALSVPLSTALHALYFDRHWATDIIGGWLGAAALGSACAAGYEVAQARKKAEVPKK